MKKIIINILLFASVYCLNSISTFAETESPIKPVSMFKAQVVPCECGTSEKNNGYYYCQTDLLQKAIKYAFCTDDLSVAMAKMNNDCNYYYAQNNTAIKNGTFDIYKLFLMKKFCNANKIRITITLASEGYSEANKKPELSLGLYKNINQCELSKRFRNRAFLHHYLMRKYEIPSRITVKQYKSGIQEIVATVDSSQIKNGDDNLPFFAVVTYMNGGFKNKMCKCGPKIKVYAYLIKVERIS